MFTKNDRFLTDIWKKNSWIPYFTPKLKKKFFLINIHILISYYLKRYFENKSQEKFCKTLVKKRWSSFLLVFLQIFPMIHIQNIFLNNTISEYEYLSKKIFFKFWSKIRGPWNFFSQIPIRKLWFLVTTCILLKEKISVSFTKFKQVLLAWWPYIWKWARWKILIFGLNASI